MYGPAARISISGLILVACGTSPGDEPSDAGTDVADAADVVADTDLDVEDDGTGDVADTGDTAVDAADASDTDAGPACDYADPRVGWVSQDVQECMVIDFDCAEQYQPFSDACGCGCRIPTTGSCDSSRFTTSGMAEPFGIDSRCEFLVFCSSLTDPTELEALVPDVFSEVTCEADPDYACPDDSVGASCLVYVETIDYDEVVAVCEITEDTRFDRFVCAGDL